MTVLLRPCFLMAPRAALCLPPPQATRAASAHSAMGWDEFLCPSSVESGLLSSFFDILRNLALLHLRLSRRKTVSRAVRPSVAALLVFSCVADQSVAAPISRK